MARSALFLTGGSGSFNRILICDFAATGFVPNARLLQGASWMESGVERKLLNVHTEGQDGEEVTRFTQTSGLAKLSSWREFTSDRSSSGCRLVAPGCPSLQIQ